MIDVLQYRAAAAAYAARFAEHVREDVYQSFLLGVMEAAHQGVQAPSDLVWKGRQEADKIVRGDWTNARPFSVVEGEDGEELDESDLLTQEADELFIKVGNVYHHSGEIADAVGDSAIPDPMFTFGFDREGRRIQEPDEAEKALRRRGLDKQLAGLGGNAWASESEEADEQDAIASAILTDEVERDDKGWPSDDWAVTDDDETRVAMIRTHAERLGIGFEKAIDELGYTRLYNQAQWEEYTLHPWVTGEQTWVSILLYPDAPARDLPPVILDGEGLEAFLGGLQDMADGKKWHEACAMKYAIRAALSGCSFKAFQDAAWVGWRAAHNRPSRPSAVDVVANHNGADRIVALRPSGIRLDLGSGRTEFADWSLAIVLAEAAALWIEPAKKDSFIEAVKTVNRPEAQQFLAAFA